MVLQNDKWSMSLEQQQALAAIIHACGVSACKSFTRYSQDSVKKQWLESFL
jgi:hypothetical protein